MPPGYLATAPRRPGGAAVRSAARSRAERARGFRAISSALGFIARRCSKRKLGAAVSPGMARDARPAVRCRFAAAGNP